MIEVPKRALDARVMLQSIRLLRSLGRAVGRSNSLVRFEAELTRGMGLFDTPFYLSQVDAAELGGMKPLRHYVLRGDAAGLSPSPLLDVRHYDAQCSDRQGINRLLHYGLIGRFQGLSPSPWFDAEYYLRCNPDVAQSGIEPLRHFVRWGWREGRNPLPGVDIRRLLASQPELRVVKGNALALFATDAIARHVQANAQERSARVPAPVPLRRQDSLQDRDMLDPELWQAVQPRQWPAAPQVDVLVPVYGGLQETLRCLYTVLTTPVRTPHEVVVINDASPLPELSAMLRTLAGRGLITLEVNRANLGFVGTVNKGLRMHRLRDVVILNSDTEVYNDWLDRLLAHARAYPRLGSITPLSNNATICSYPETLGDNRLPLELPHDEIDRLAAEVNRLRHVTAPTGVGFCMYLRRAALRDVGLLDERRFGRGYGEENDLCQRMLQRGWTNAIACDIYVRHVGSVSFKGEAAQRTARAIRTLERLYPDYNQQVARHIAADPALPYRARLDLARLKRLRRDRNVLLVCHSRGGGTERHLLEESQRLLAEGSGVFELRPSPQADAVALVHPGLYGLHNLAALSLAPGGLFDEAVEELGLNEIHVHHLIDFAPRTAERLTEIAAARALSLRVAVHDYYSVCPRVNLINAEGRYCGDADAEACNRCLSADQMISQTGPIDAWRSRHAHLLSVADQLVVPSEDVARRMVRLMPGLTPEVEPHEDEPPPRVSASPLVPAGQSVRVMVIGAISRIKGFDVVLGLARAARQAQLPLELSLLGYSMNDGELASQGVRLLGRYFDNELGERIHQADPHLILVPSVWPETYCYVLSGALHSGRRVAVFDLGAQADRARQHDPHHLVLPLALADRHEELARLLLGSARAPELAPGAEPVRAQGGA
ncbi:glycosyltransferase [Ideonella sp. 4Y11]|uniref:Glycosyltransferase n=1 Tax=Ideonella aquatica TaxID=2824119 RepID=A0A941BGL4_9BURK|nr:glycosyltransferase [Ideonella aquatica]